MPALLLNSKYNPRAPEGMGAKGFFSLIWAKFLFSTFNLYIVGPQWIQNIDPTKFLNLPEPLQTQGKVEEKKMTIFQCKVVKMLLHIIDRGLF